MIYEYDDGRDAAFDIHTSWVTPDNFPGYVEQEVQFRFDNGVWNGHSRKRGVECTVEDETPLKRKITMNNHYNGTFLEPWGERSQRGYGVEVLDRFARELAYVKFGGSPTEQPQRLTEIQSLTYNDLAADRQSVAAVQALEAILDHHAKGEPDCVVRVNDSKGGLVLYRPGSDVPVVLYEGQV
jgi:D-galacturonate reductase